MRARRTDANLSAIVSAARHAGFLVNVRNDDLADLDVQHPRNLDRTELWECKILKGARFTARQKLQRAKGWMIYTVRTTDDIIEALERFKP